MHRRETSQDLRDSLFQSGMGAKLMEWFNILERHERMNTPLVSVWLKLQPVLHAVDKTGKRLCPNVTKQHLRLTYQSKISNLLIC